MQFSFSLEIIEIFESGWVSPDFMSALRNQVKT